MHRSSYLNTMKKSIIICVLITIAMSINQELPKLVKTNYQGKAKGGLNVTIGEKFSLPLPHFDTPWENTHFQVYEVPQQEYNKISSAKSDSNSSIEIPNEKKVEIDYLPFECNLKSGKIYIKEELKSLREEYSRSKNSVWQQNQYIHLSFRSLLYILKIGSSEIIAYLYNEQTIDKLTTYKINDFIQREESASDLNKSPPVLALNTMEDYLYMFTSLGVWQIKTRTVLTDVRKVEGLSGFDSKQYGGIDKVLHGQGDIMVGLKRLSKVFVIPEPTGNPADKLTFKEITSFKGIADFFPQDIFMISNTLYVLDYKKGVYIYTILKAGEITERSFIPFESFGGNFMFTVYQSSIFINFNDIDGSKIVEISYDLESQQHYLVRYIKSQDYICQINVINAMTSYEGKPVNHKYGEESFDTFLFILLNFDDIEIYPFNLDPRIISQAYNAVKLKGSDIRKIFHLKLDKYLIITNDLIKYVRITIEKPAVVCKTKRLEDSSPSKFFRLAVTANVSTCEHQDHDLPQKKMFYEYCQLQTSYLVHIGDPEESQFQRFMLAGVVLGVVTLFIGGLVCLMQWRKNKMMILGRLRVEIQKFRNRHKKMQPFTEQNIQQKEIEIEMPVVHVAAEENE